MQLIIDRVRAHPKRVVFAEGEEEKTIRAALAWHNDGLGTAGPDRPRGADPRDRADAIGLRLPEGSPRDPQRQAVDQEPRLRRAALPPQPAQRPAVPRLPAAGQPGPQRVRRLHGRRGRCRRDGDRAHPQLHQRPARRPPGDRPQARRAPARPHDDVVARPHRVHRGHHRPRAADARRARRHRDPDRARRPPHGLHAPGRAAVVLDLRQPADREGDCASRTRSTSSTGARSISSTTARCRSTWRSTPSSSRSIRSAACRSPRTC